MTRSPSLPPAELRDVALPTSSGRRSLWLEASASVADMGTFLPLAVGVSIACGLEFGMVLICAGLANIYSGWRFGQPIAVQPMKVLAAAAIAGGWGANDLAMSGLVMGILMIALSLSGLAQRISSCMPGSAVRGIQLAAAGMLVSKGLTWLMAIPLFPVIGRFDCLLLGTAALILMYLPRLPRGWSVLGVFIAGLLFSLLAGEASTATLSTAPVAPVTWYTVAEGTLLQLPLTLLNSVIAVCALSEGCFPGRGVSTGRMSLNVGCINLLAAATGGMPMCHGSGGMAALHRCGARTGAAPMLLGFAMLLGGLLFSQSALDVLQGFPRSLLAAMLLMTSITLAAHALAPTLHNRRALLAVCGTAVLLLAIQLAS